MMPGRWTFGKGGKQEDEDNGLRDGRKQAQILPGKNAPGLPRQIHGRNTPRGARVGMCKSFFFLPFGGVVNVGSILYGELRLLTRGKQLLVQASLEGWKGRKKHARQPSSFFLCYLYSFVVIPDASLWYIVVRFRPSRADSRIFRLCRLCLQVPIGTTRWPIARRILPPLTGPGVNVNPADASGMHEKVGVAELSQRPLAQ